MKPFLRNYGPPILSGILLALSFPGWGLYPLAWVALAPLFRQCMHLSPWRVFGRFLLSGLVFYALLLQWLLTNVYWAGGWAVFGYAALCLIMALYWGLTGALWSFIQRRLPVPAGMLSLAIMWAAMEFLQSRLLSGFGWGSIAYSQGKDIYLLQLASVAGAFFITAVIVRVNTLIAEAIVDKRVFRRILFFAVAALIIIAVHGVGYLLLGRPDVNSRPLRVGIVQSNFPLEMKWDREYAIEMVRNTAEKSRALVRAQPLDLIVWPEALITTDIDRPEIWSIVSELARDTGAYIFTGSSRRNEETGGFLNSSHLIAPQGTIAGYYDKVHLAPFGEYVPFGEYFPFIKSIVPAIGDVEFGKGQKVFPVAGRTIGPLICFEVLFSNLAEELRSRGADLLVVITNLGWFGESNAIPQEMEIARMRAVETRLPQIHCANTGVSGVFDPWGRFQVANGYFTSGGNFGFFSREARPEEIITERVGGIFDLPAAAPRPVPVLPWLFPWLMVGLSGAALIAAACASRKKAASKIK